MVLNTQVAFESVSVQPPPDLSGGNGIYLAATPVEVLSGRSTIQLTTTSHSFGDVCSDSDPACPIEFMFYLSTLVRGQQEVVPLMDSFSTLQDSTIGSPSLSVVAPVLNLPAEEGPAEVTFGVMIRDPARQVRTLTALVAPQPMVIQQTVTVPVDMASGQTLQDVQASLDSLQGNSGSPTLASGSLAAVLLVGLSGGDPSELGLPPAEVEVRQQELDLAVGTLVPEVLHGVARSGSGCDLGPPFLSA
eukprot:gene2292-3146_t